jgi:hypothetical protein
MDHVKALTDWGRLRRFVAAHDPPDEMTVALLAAGDALAGQIRYLLGHQDQPVGPELDLFASSLEASRRMVTGLVFDTLDRLGILPTLERMTDAIAAMHAERHPDERPLTHAED